MSRRPFVFRVRPDRFDRPREGRSRSVRSGAGPRAAALCVAVLCAAGCVALDYDLSGIPVPVDARPAPAGASVVEPFRVEANNVLWAHGLFGHEQPDVAALVAEQAEGYDRIANFRVRQTSNGHIWLATHLSLSLFRMRKVVIEGQRVRD